MLRRVLNLKFSCQLQNQQLLRFCTKHICEQTKAVAQKKERELFDPKLLPRGICDAKDARAVAEKLLVGERKLLWNALRKSMADQYEEHKKLGNVEIHCDDYLRMWYIYFVPAFAIGVLDSVILIYSGEYIYQYFAAGIGVSLLGAAAAGNVISNILMIRTHWIENVMASYSKYTKTTLFTRPVLSAEQLQNKELKFIINFAKMFGIGIGTTLGLFPLYWYETVEMKSEKERQKASLFARTFSEEMEYSYAISEQEQETYRKGPSTTEKTIKLGEMMVDLSSAEESALESATS